MSFIPRIYLDPNLFDPLVNHQENPIPVHVVHYLGNVLRLNVGDHIIFFNNRDGEWQCSLQSITKNKGTILPQQQLRLPINPIGPTLIFAPLKRDATDLAIRMATELGVQIIQPIKTIRTNTTRIKEERFRAITIEAAEQSNRLTIPEIKPIISLFDFLDTWPKHKTLWIALERCHEYNIPVKVNHNYCGEDGILIGPEGGFDPNEIKNLLLYDFVQPLSLGNLILKAETAVVAGLARFSQHVHA